MRILKKLSLRRGLDRMMQPNFSEPKLNRAIHHECAHFQLTPQQELHKYAVKPAFFQFKWAMAMLFGGLSAVYIKLYLDQLYNNQLDTIYRYRYHEKQIPSTKMYIRMILQSLILYFQNNFYTSAYFKKQSVGQQSFEQFAEGLVRYGQYKNYMERKDRKFDFLDIGVMEKYPYVKKSQQPSMM